VRATMLYDTISARLDKDIDFYEEFRKNERRAGRRLRNDLGKKIADTFEHGIDPKYFLRLEQWGNLGNQLLFRLQNTAYANPFRFARMVSKGYYFLNVLFRSVFFICVVTALITLGRMIFGRSDGKRPGFFSQLDHIYSNSWYQAGLALFLLLVARKVLLRWNDKDD
jgi:hypothetical protein